MCEGPQPDGHNLSKPETLNPKPFLMIQRPMHVSKVGRKSWLYHHWVDRGLNPVE